MLFQTHFFHLWTQKEKIKYNAQVAIIWCQTIPHYFKWIMLFHGAITADKNINVKLKHLNDGFITNTQLFTSQDVKWWTGVMWITWGFLWCFYQLFGLSCWWHPFTAEDPLVSKWCNAKFNQICSDEWTNLSIFWMAWGGVNFQLI